MTNLKKRSNIIKHLMSAKKQSKKIVFTNGCFDLLHDGHIQLIKEAKEQGDILVVGLNSDASVKRLKGNERPIQNQEDRISALLELEEVDEVIVFKEDTPKQLIAELTPDVLVKGADYKNKEVIGAKHVIANGGRLHYARLLKGFSTTASINKRLSTKK